MRSGMTREQTLRAARLELAGVEGLLFAVGLTSCLALSLAESEAAALLRATVVLAAIALVASYLPALRASIETRQI
ncbi:MAG: hypothetical protein ACYDCG_10620 [Candidatus Acidiferrales bacterium]